MSNKLKYVHNDTEFILTIERGLDEYLGDLWAGLEAEDADPNISATDEISLTGVSFCGCDTCINRETFAYLVPHIIDGYKAGKFELNEEYHDTDTVG